MSLQFLRGNPQAPKGHAIFIARSSSDPRTVFCTYCLVPPIPMSLAKYLPPLFAAQLPPEELGDTTNIAGMPIPPMLEEVFNLEQLEELAERRDDDLCDIGIVNTRDEVGRMQMANISSQEYAQLYANALVYPTRIPTYPPPGSLSEPVALDDLDAEALVLETLSDRQKLAELGKLVGTARYAVGGQDTSLLQETQKRMLRIARRLPDKYRANELSNAAINPKEQGARLAELYLSRAYKLLDEEYAEIPAIERAIRDLQQ